MSARSVSVGTCPACGKQRFASRSLAKRVARTQYPGIRLSAYRCGDYFHLGKLPTVVSRGRSSRDSMRAYPPSVTRQERPTIG